MAVEPSLDLHLCGVGGLWPEAGWKSLELLKNTMRRLEAALDWGGSLVGEVPELLTTVPAPAAGQTISGTRHLGHTQVCDRQLEVTLVEHFCACFLAARSSRSAHSPVRRQGAADILKRLRPVTATDCCRRGLARDLVTDLRRLDRAVKDNESQMRDALDATGTTLTELTGMRTALAAKVLGHVGNIDRFPTEHHFASYTGCAPLEASSGNMTRHPTQHRREPCPQLRIAHHRPQDIRRKDTCRSTPCLKRRLSNAIYRTMKRDQRKLLPV